MPYNSETGQYERRVTTILDETPDGDTVNSAVAVKIDAAVDDGPTDLNHHKVQGGHYPATSTATGSRYLHQSPAGVVSWRDGVPADQAAQANASNVTDGAAWRAAIGAEVAGAGVAAATAAVTTHNTDASAHGLDITVWPVAQGGTGASTAEDARAALDVYSKSEADAAGVVPGLIEIFPMVAIPPRRLKCNGAAVSRTAYAELFAAIGTTYGEGDGSLTFNIPDLRGEFVRGWDDGRGVDPDRVLGSAQSDAMRNITGKFWAQNDALFGGGDGVFAGDSWTSSRGHGGSGGSYKGVNIDASRQVPTAEENRPRNIAFIYTIAY